ncbi:hypothetical protein CCR98_07735 [Stenotrophomonas sp. WZN-1]|uniref:hypothetical protein n=1 Tax=Stenotrophomonas sp. WZN-1 TaxID=2005046 RepID=UPI000B446AD5|nr:hypothetical protein [Stenotrophomonas sp. WZN-1]ARZ74065.1 hypothetical protein CCR98_07735 [Stenotrophomonas sp. WZN-1]
MTEPNVTGLSWADYWMGRGQPDVSHDFDAFARAEAWALQRFTPPEGYVLVPVEPTEAMLRAGGWVEPPDANGQQCIEKQGAAQCWKLMMNARPEVP